MPRYTASPAYRDSGPYPVGVLLVNSGTPDSLTNRGLRAFLRRLLRDRRTIEVPRAIWCWILYGFILPLRPALVLPKYRRIWTAQGSPLLLHSQRLASALEQSLSLQQGSVFAVELGMLFSTPNVAQGLARLRDRGAQRIIVLPLFPQYSGSTTAAAYDHVGVALRSWRFVPELRFISDYPVQAGYVAAIAQSIRNHRDAYPDAQHLVFSFHGIPSSYVAGGDPYERKCHATATAVARQLGLENGSWSVSFQSRVGTARWLGPYTVAHVRELASRGVRRLEVICPGFAMDCLETVDEMGHECAEVFRTAGGESLRYIPALNDTPEHVAVLTDLVMEHAR